MSASGHGSRAGIKAWALNALFCPGFVYPSRRKANGTVRAELAPSVMKTDPGRNVQMQRPPSRLKLISILSLAVELLFVPNVASEKKLKPS